MYAPAKLSEKGTLEEQSISIPKKSNLRLTLDVLKYNALRLIFIILVIIMVGLTIGSVLVLWQNEQSVRGGIEELPRWWLWQTRLDALYCIVLAFVANALGFGKKKTL